MAVKIQVARRTVIAIVSLAAVYFLAGKFGLSLATEHASASAIWPPSGIALAALLLWGYRIWPGVFLGAFLVNITTAGGLATTLGIASGNTLGAFVGAWLINHFANGHKVFERAKNIFKFVLLAGLISTAVSATLGVTSLTLGGYAQWDRYAAIWFTWWLGDIAGDLLIAPLLVIWLTQPYPDLKSRRIFEAAGLLLSILSLGYIVFLSGRRTRLRVRLDSTASMGGVPIWATRCCHCRVSHVRNCVSGHRPRDWPFRHCGSE